MTIPQISVSWGELIDKITILEIKVERLLAEDARDNAAMELALLQNVAAGNIAQVANLTAELKAVNMTLWDIEDSIRDHERNMTFGSDFIQLARSVYRTNDIRSALKLRINRALGSVLVEQKNYKPY